MQTLTLEFPYSTRTTYTSIKNLFRKQTGFSSIECNDDLFVVEVRHGSFLSPFSEKIKIKVAATSSESCNVVVESSSRSVLNLINWGANKDNVSNLSDCINNEVFKLMPKDGIKMIQQESHSAIRIVDLEIKFK